MIYEIELMNVGRSNQSYNIIYEADDLRGAEKLALLECKKWLLSSDVNLISKKKTKFVYVVTAGLRSVGEVCIKEVKEDD